MLPVAWLPEGMAVAAAPASQSLHTSGFPAATYLTNMDAQRFFPLPCPALLTTHPPQVTPGLLFFRTQINFTVAIDFTASNGKWGRSVCVWGCLWAVVDNSAVSQVPNTSSCSWWVTLFLVRCKQTCSPQIGNQHQSPKGACWARLQECE